MNLSGRHADDEVDLRFEKAVENRSDAQRMSFRSARMSSMR